MTIYDIISKKKKKRRKVFIVGFLNFEYVVLIKCHPSMSDQ